MVSRRNAWRIFTVLLLMSSALTALASDAEQAERLIAQSVQQRRDGNYAEAARLAEQARDAAGTDNALAAQSTYEAAEAYRLLGKYEPALPLAEKALALREKHLGEMTPDAAASLHQLSEIQSALGDYQKAKPLADKALGIREQTLGIDHPDTAESYNDLGNLYQHMGDRDRAREAYERGLAIRERTLGPDDRATAESLNNLGTVYWGDRDYDRAADVFGRALVIQEVVLGAEHPVTASTHSNLGEVHRQLAKKYGGGGDLAREAKEWNEAAEHMLQAVAIWEKTLGPEHPRMAVIYNNLAWFYFERRDSAKAIVNFERARNASEKAFGAGHPQTANSILLLAAFHQNDGNYDEALALYRQGLPLEDQFFANVFAVTSEQQKLRFIDSFQGHYFAALSLIQQRFPKDPDAVRLGLNLVLRRKGIVLDAESRAREALEQQLDGAVLASWRQLAEHRAELSQLLDVAESGKPSAEYRLKVKRLQEQIRTEEESLARHSPLIAQELAQRSVTVESIVGLLPEDAALVEFVLIPDWDESRLAWAETTRYLAFVLTSDGEVTLVDLGDASALEKKVLATRTSIGDYRLFSDLPAYVEKTNAGLSDLHASVLQPLAAPIGERSRLILSPDGRLNEVPFQALRDAEGHYEVESRTMSYLTSGRDLLREKSDVVPTLDLLLVANPSFDERNVLAPAVPAQERALRPAGFRHEFGPLPGTAEEAEIIPPLVSGSKKILLKGEARESAVRDTRSPRILHLATHGFFLGDAKASPPDPLGRSFRGKKPQAGRPQKAMTRSGLAFAGANHASSVTAGEDGILTALEVSGMSLYGTDLVVLSACETALGEIRAGEGVYGLRRAFLLAGARNLVMSLWPVDDQYTRDLMEQFYKAYGSGTPPAEALQQAQRLTIKSLQERVGAGKDGKAMAPVNLWAPFVVQETGRPSP